MIAALRWLVGTVILLVLVVFALSNRQPVLLRFWPTDLALQVPLSVAVLIGLAAGLLIAGFWLGTRAAMARRRARRAERRVRRMEDAAQRTPTVA